MRKLFVTGIGTGIGKTTVAAILCEALKADYWKPVQAGSLGDTDSMKARSLISNEKTIIHPETFLLSQPMSPHAAAAIDRKQIELNKFSVPATENTLVIEGAGGLMVPLNQKDLVLDLVLQLHAEVVLVSQNYLGSINHTLLTAEALKSRNIKCIGIIFNGEKNGFSETFILDYTKLRFLGRVNPEKSFDKETVSKYAMKFRGVLN